MRIDNMEEEFITEEEVSEKVLRIPSGEDRQEAAAESKQENISRWNKAPEKRGP